VKKTASQKEETEHSRERDRQTHTQRERGRGGAMAWGDYGLLKYLFSCQTNDLNIFFAFLFLEKV
jgi:hypothetical protein